MGKAHPVPFVLKPEIVLRPFQKYPRQPFHTLIPRAPPAGSSNFQLDALCLIHLATHLLVSAISLLESLLQFDPALRCSAHEALQHPYFQSSASPAPAPQAGPQPTSQQQQQYQQALLAQQQQLRAQQQQQEYQVRLASQTSHVRPDMF